MFLSFANCSKAPTQGSKEIFLRENSIIDPVEKEDVEKFKNNKFENSKSRLSSAPIDVATLQDKLQSQRPVANTPTTDKQNTLQGLASLGLNFFS